MDILAVEGFSGGVKVVDAAAGHGEDTCLITTSDRRWYMVAVAGTLLSALSLLCNMLIAVVLLRARHSHFFFLAILAVSDAFLSLMYAPVIAMDIIKDRLQILWLSRAYWTYISPLLALCQTSMTFSTYLILLASIERFLITEKSNILNGFRKRRCLLVAFVFIAALLLRGTAVMEVFMEKNGNCTGLTEYIVNLTPLARNSWLYGTIFRFYLRNILTVLFPFFTLAYINIRIVRTLRRQQRAAAMFRFATSKHKVLTMTQMQLKVRSATRLMVLIVCSYLTANFLNVVVTCWEYIHPESTQYDTFYEIYELITDIISVMYIFVCATRLFVYVSCNEEIRHDVVVFLRALCVWRRRFEKESIGGSPGAKGGTELDSIAVAIARRLLAADVSPSENVDLAICQTAKGNKNKALTNGSATVVSNGVCSITEEEEDEEESEEVEYI